MTGPLSATRQPAVESADRIPAGLTVLGSARWPAETDPDGPTGALPRLPGFIESTFSPLVAAVADECLSGRYGAAPLADGERVAVLLATVRGDMSIARAIAATVDAGRRMSPLLFFQSVANAVLGHVAARWGLGGPVLCVSPVGEPYDDAMGLAASLVDTGEADAVLVMFVEQSWTPDERDRASAFLVAAGDPGGPDRHDNQGDRL
ncbi:MAG: hypothetical protein WCA46_19060 [Actinocatenispora sp.]